MSRWGRLFAVTAALLIAGHHFYAAYRLRDTIVQAVHAGRPELLAPAVDFAAIRESARQQFEEKLASESPTPNVRFGRAALDAFLLRSVTQQFVDRIATPEGLVGMLQGRDQTRPAPVQPMSSAVPDPFEAASLEWDSPVRVRIANIGRRDGVGGVTLVLTRTLTSWRVSDLDLERAL